MAHRKEREIANCTLISAQELNLFDIIKGRGQKPKHTGNYIFKIIIDSFAVSVFFLPLMFVPIQHLHMHITYSLNSMHLTDQIEAPLLE